MITAVVTKQWPTLSANGTLSVGVEIVLNDDDVEFRRINALEQRRQVFTRNASKGDDVEVKGDEIAKDVQVWIDAYITEKKTHKHAKYNALRDFVQNGLSLSE